MICTDCFDFLDNLEELTERDKAKFELVSTACLVVYYFNSCCKLFIFCISGYCFRRELRQLKVACFGTNRIAPTFEDDAEEASRVANAIQNVNNLTATFENANIKKNSADTVNSDSIPTDHIA
mgnify:CR=1 FL=1